MIRLLLDSVPKATTPVSGQIRTIGILPAMRLLGTNFPNRAEAVQDGEIPTTVVVVRAVTSPLVIPATRGRHASDRTRLRVTLGAVRRAATTAEMERAIAAGMHLATKGAIVTKDAIASKDATAIKAVVVVGVGRRGTAVVTLRAATPLRSVSRQSVIHLHAIKGKDNHFMPENPKDLVCLQNAR